MIIDKILSFVGNNLLDLGFGALIVYGLFRLWSDRELQKKIYSFLSKFKRNPKVEEGNTIKLEEKQNDLK